MTQPHLDTTSPDNTAAPVEPAPAKSWPEEVLDLLVKAAALCADHGVDLDSWMKGAWGAYMDARPGYREYLEEQQLISQLDELRKAGKLEIA